MLNRIFNTRNIITIGMSFLIASCSTVTKQNADWGYQKDGIVIYITADDNLNMYDGDKHNLSVAVIQVSSPKKYATLLQTSDGISSAIANDTKFDGQTGFNRIYITPSEKTQLTFDREKGTEYVYFVFGYANAKDSSENSRLIDIPFDGGWWGDGPLDLKLDMDLGSDSVNSLKPEKESSYGFF